MTAWIAGITGLSAFAAAAFWLRRQYLAQQDALEKNRHDLSLALRGTGEAIWTWHLDTQEISQVGFEPLTEGHFPARVNAIEFIQVFIHPEDAPDFQDAVDKHLQGLTPHFEVSYRLRHYKQGWVWISTRVGLSIAVARAIPRALAAPAAISTASVNSKATAGLHWPW